MTYISKSLKIVISIIKCSGIRQENILLFLARLDQLPFHYSQLLHIIKFFLQASAFLQDLQIIKKCSVSLTDNKKKKKNSTPNLNAFNKLNANFTLFYSTFKKLYSLNIRIALAILGLFYKIINS